MPKSKVAWFCAALWQDFTPPLTIALTKANAGKGVVAGLAVAFIAIMSDRLINAAVQGRLPKGTSDV